jgi:hypothetical protein
VNISATASSRSRSSRPDRAKGSRSRPASFEPSAVADRQSARSRPILDVRQHGQKPSTSHPASVSNSTTHNATNTNSTKSRPVRPPVIGRLLASSFCLATEGRPAGRRQLSWATCP